MKVTIVPIVIGALGTVTKGLLKGLEDLEVGGRVETIQTTALLRTARILRRVLETWGDVLSLKLQWKNHQLKLMWKTLKELDNKPLARKLIFDNTEKNKKQKKNAIRTLSNQKYSRCRLCIDRDEMINYIISECSKLA